MLKLISVQQLQMGMYIHQFCGSWLDHSFWKAGFVLNSHADLQRLRQSNVSSLWIDSDKGLDLPANPHPSAPAALPSLKSEAPLRVERAEEIQRALKICAHSKKAVMQMFQEVRMGQAIELVQVDELVHNISSSLLRHPDVLISLARLKTADDYTYMHSVAVCALMVGLGRQIGMSEDEAREAGLAGLLHDIGKMQMPLEVLNKPGSLTDDEFRVMRSHPERGYDLLQEGSQVPDSALDVCLHHHEKIDGTGYPHRLPGDKISKLARMGAICDVYDAITSTRPYKNAWDPAGSL